jgi:hypothetical protein
MSGTLRAAVFGANDGLVPTGAALMTRDRSADPVEATRLQPSGIEHCATTGRRYRPLTRRNPPTAVRTAMPVITTEVGA